MRCAVLIPRLAVAALSTSSQSVETAANPPLSWDAIGPQNHGTSRCSSLRLEKVTYLHTSCSFDLITHREPAFMLRAPWQRDGGHPGKWPGAGRSPFKAHRGPGSPCSDKAHHPRAYRAALLSFSSKFQPEDKKQLNCVGGHRDLSRDLCLKNKLTVCE